MIIPPIIAIIGVAIIIMIMDISAAPRLTRVVCAIRFRMLTKIFGKLIAKRMPIITEISNDFFLFTIIN